LTTSLRQSRYAGALRASHLAHECGRPVVELRQDFWPRVE
jgi:hypothetical protein